MTRRRARNQEAREARKREIVISTLSMLSQSTYHSLTMNEIAEHAQVSKGTLYRYFSTKEALFLHIISELHERWLVELDNQLDDLDAPSDAHTVAALLTATLIDHDPLAALLTLLHQTIEHHIDAAEAMHFRRRLRDDMLPTAETLEQYLPSLQPGDGFRFLLWTQALICGLYPMANPGPVMQTTFRALDLSMFRMDFAGELHRSIVHLLQGWTP